MVIFGRFERKTSAGIRIDSILNLMKTKRRNLTRLCGTSTVRIYNSLIIYIYRVSFRFDETILQLVTISFHSVVAESTAHMLLRR